MGNTALTFRWERRPRDMRVIKTLILACAGATLLWPQAAELKTTQAVLEKYQRALGGADSTSGKSNPRRAMARSKGTASRAKRPSLRDAEPFKTLSKVTLPGGAQIVSGFNGSGEGGSGASHWARI